MGRSFNRVAGVKWCTQELFSCQQQQNNYQSEIKADRLAQRQVKEEAAAAAARERRLLHEEDAGEDKHVRVTLLLTTSDASVEIGEHGSAARLCLQARR